MKSYHSVVTLLAILYTIIPLVSYAGDKEKRIMVSCATTAGGEPLTFASCVGQRLTGEEIKNLFNGKAFGCGNEIRKLFRPWDKGCKNKSHPKPEFVFIMPYKEGFIIGYESGGHSLYYSPDGHNLRGGEATALVYSAGQRVVKIEPYKGGVKTSFNQGGIYFSPDGYNLGGGGNTKFLGWWNR